mmetsp:Transcript_33035/g.60898  ORF Transcript_33035/g.60898 Transcript_33035/m.60898 type:complete len:204 (+) Transcript_33035:114-725(+)
MLVWQVRQLCWRTPPETFILLWLIYYKQFPLASLHTLSLETSMPLAFGCGTTAPPPISAFVSVSTARPSVFALLVTTSVFLSTFFITTLVSLFTFFITFLVFWFAFFTSLLSCLVMGLVFFVTARSIFLASFVRTRSILETSLFKESNPAWSLSAAVVSVVLATATEGHSRNAATPVVDVCRNDARDEQEELLILPTDDDGRT